jgi:hypothetical protein
MKSYPIPSTLYDLTPSEFISSGYAKIDPCGSTPIIFIFGFFSFNFLPTPVIVPPVPTPTTK